MGIFLALIVHQSLKGQISISDISRHYYIYSSNCCYVTLFSAVFSILLVSKFGVYSQVVSISVPYWWLHVAFIWWLIFSDISGTRDWQSWSDKKTVKSCYCWEGGTSKESLDNRNIIEQQIELSVRHRWSYVRSVCERKGYFPQALNPIIYTVAFKYLLQIELLKTMSWPCWVVFHKRGQMPWVSWKIGFCGTHSKSLLR